MKLWTSKTLGLMATTTLFAFESKCSAFVISSRRYYSHKFPLVRSMVAQIDPVTTPFNLTSFNQTSDGKRSKHKRAPPPPPPIPEPSEFPDWAYKPRDFFRFEILHESSKSQARVGRIHTPHGIIDTPGYVAVATNAALKGLDFRGADEAGQQLVFANTYHLMLHPGADLIKEAGGIHKFVNRQKPFITDSGGFQVFSLAYGSVHEELSSKGELKRANRGSNKHNHHVMGKDAVKVSEDGVTFQSYRDGTRYVDQGFFPDTNTKSFVLVLTYLLDFC